jgi:lipopolysaccharide/colanic/teichoic acid biosynthesis glycosyltransferase
MAKRVFDLVIAFIATLLFLPFLLPIAIFLRFTGEGEVFYKQKRIGTANETFDIWKFATMLKNSPNMGTADVTLKNDPRVLPMGDFLRKTKINELPQIINVWNGTMSIVGARPLMKRSFDLYSEDVRKVIYNTPPGITGIGSLIFRDEESLIDNSGQDPMKFYEETILPYKGSLEKWYQANQSFFTDVKVIILTAWVLVFPKSDLAYKWFDTLPKRPF